MNAAVENALHAWAAGRLGIPVIWADQPGPQPQRPYATLKLGGPTVVGMDEERTSTDLTRPAGEEVEIAVVGQRTASLSVNVFATPPDSALALITDLQASLGLPSVRAALRGAGIAVLSAGPVQDISFLEDSAERIERRQMDVQLGLSSEVTERTGYIATVDVAGEVE